MARYRVRTVNVYRWCPGPESNRHASRRGILSPLRLPISPPGHGREDQDYATDFLAYWPAVKKLGSWWWMSLRWGWFGQRLDSVGTLPIYVIGINGGNFCSQTFKMKESFAEFRSRRLSNVLVLCVYWDVLRTIRLFTLEPTYVSLSSNLATL